MGVSENGAYTILYAPIYGDSNGDKPGDFGYIYI
jgi:hypothetical protein